MAALLLGLAIFLGAHSIGLFAVEWRAAWRERIGAGRWKLLVALVSLLGFVLLAWGFGMARQEPTILWLPPFWLRHVTALLMLASFILLAAAYVPGTRIKSAIGHPMIVATKVWAGAHLIANGTLAGTVLFGAFLAWSIAAFAILRRRDRIAGTRIPSAGASRDALAVIIGAVAWGFFAHVGHYWLIGVRPFG